MEKEKPKFGCKPKHVGGSMRHRKAINYNDLHKDIMLCIKEKTGMLFGDFLVQCLLDWDVKNNKAAMVQKYENGGK